MRFPFLPAAGLLFCLGVLAGVATAAEQTTQGLRYPSLAPDGKSVVFTYRGDVWIAPVEGGGLPRRLTLHEAQETLARISPDGKQIAFSSARNGTYDLFLIPIEGGIPKQVSFHSAWEAMNDWSPDGKKLLFCSPQSVDRGQTDLYELDLENEGTPRRLTFDGGRDGSYSPDGKWIVYSRGAVGIYQDDYEGSANHDLYLIPVEGGMPRRLTDTAGNERFPFFSADGKTIYFTAEEKKVRNFYSMPVEGGERTQVTKYAGADVNRPNLAYDRKTMVFERVGRLYVTDLTAPTEQPKALGIKIEADVRDSGIEIRSITQGGEHVDVSRDGRWVAFSLRGDIWMMPASGGEGRQLTHGPANDQWPRFSPDGSSVAYCTNKTGNSDIFVLDLRSRSERRVTNHAANDFFQSWSPDGRRLVFTSERSGNKDIWVIDLDSGQETQLTNHAAADDDPVYSPDGRLIAFDSGREGQQGIFVMEADGSNVRRVTTGTDFLQVPNWSPDGRMLVFEGMSPVTGRSEGLYVISVDGGPTVQVARDGGGACWTAAGDYIYFSADRGRDDNGIWRVRAPTTIVVGERVPFLGKVEVNRREELGQLFDEAWQALAEGFYDPKMHGVDWAAMRKKYRDWAVDSEIKEEFHAVIRQMLAELGASHLGIFGGEQNGNSAQPDLVQTGYLGLEFSATANEDGTRTVTSIVPGGPADQAGLRMGDVITRIGNEKLTAKVNLDKLLTGTVGKDLPVAFRPKLVEGWGVERSVALEPVLWRAIAQLKYKAWVEGCERLVEEKTGDKQGEVGYVHLDQMNPQNLQKFQQAVSRWNGNSKIRAMILDVRNNGGGNIHNQLMEILGARPLARVQMRGRPKMTQPALYWDRPVVVLINENSFSDAEVFPFMFKAAGIGPVIGVPTAGGVIGTNDITLSDGSMFRIPRTGFWSMDGTNLEGLGVQPDYLVAETPEDRLQGRDPQLLKAIEVVLDLVKQREEAAKAAAGKAETPETATPEAPQPETPTPPQPEQPAPQPRELPAADALHPLADAAVGEWVRYRLTVPGVEGESVVKVSVVEVRDGSVGFRQEIEKGGAMPVPFPPRMAQAGSLAESLAAFGTVSQVQTLRGPVAGAQADMATARMRWPDGTDLDLKFSNVVPAYGLYQVWMGKQLLIEAIEWGMPAREVAESPAAAPSTPASPDAHPAEAEPEQHAAEAAAAPARPGHPVHDAQVGEWAVYSRAGPDGQEIRMKLTVSEADDSEVVLSQTIQLPDGREVEGPQVRRPRNEFLEPNNDQLVLKGYDKQTITVAGRSWDCDVMITEDTSGAEMRIYVSNEVPVSGLVRLERDGETVMELVEFGTS